MNKTYLQQSQNLLAKYQVSKAEKNRADTTKPNYTIPTRHANKTYLEISENQTSQHEKLYNDLERGKQRIMLNEYGKYNKDFINAVKNKLTSLRTPSTRNDFISDHIVVGWKGTFQQSLFDVSSSLVKDSNELQKLSQKINEQWCHLDDILINTESKYKKTVWKRPLIFPTVIFGWVMSVMGFIPIYGLLRVDFQEGFGTLWGNISNNPDQLLGVLIFFLLGIFIIILGLIPSFRLSKSRAKTIIPDTGFVSELNRHLISFGTLHSQWERSRVYVRDKELSRLENKLKEDLKEVNIKADKLSTVARIEHTKGKGKVNEDLAMWRAQARGDLNRSITNCEELFTQHQLLSPSRDNLQWKSRDFSKLRIGEISIDNIFSIPIHFSMTSGWNLLFSNLDNLVTIAINQICITMLETHSAGKVNFTFVDPLTRGEVFSPFLVLRDFSKQLIGEKIWADHRQVEQQIDELTEHIDTVVQKYLRGEYSTLEDYNAQAGALSEPYRVLVFYGIPQDLSREACQKLMALMRNGERCGIRVIFASNGDSLPRDLDWVELHQLSHVIGHNGQHWQYMDGDLQSNNNSWQYNNGELNQHALVFDSLPDKASIDAIVQDVGAKAVEAGKVEMDFTGVIKDTPLWSMSNTEVLNIPIGLTGAQKLHNLTFGTGTTHHALLAGTTGSGKSNLLHVLITSAAYCYNPDELELYLLDFKEGVEFKRYATYPLPHVRVVSIQSEREMGLSVLRDLQNELKERGQLFQQNDVANLSAYRQKTGNTLPRVLLIIDEFQVLLAENDNLATDAQSLLDNIALQGRSFGIHMILATQTLQGMGNSLKKIQTQSNVRIAMQCKAEDAQLIMSSQNTLAVTNLSRSGEGIYNNDAGAETANIPFQAAFLNDKDESKFATLLLQIQQRTKNEGIENSTFVFDGTKIAEISNSDAIHHLAEQTPSETRPKKSIAILGEPTEIKASTHATFKAERGNHLAIFCKDEAFGFGMLQSCLASLALQHTGETASFELVDFIGASGDYQHLWQESINCLNHKFSTDKVNHRDFKEFIDGCLGMIDDYLKEEQVSPANQFVILYGLHKARDLRDDRDIQQTLQAILKDAPDVGLHFIIWSDSYEGFKRSLGMNALKDIDMRVTITQNLEELREITGDYRTKLHDNRGLFIDVETGEREKFKPYTAPNKQWFEWLRKKA